MPDHGRRTEAQRETSLLQPPANIDVIAGGAKCGIKAADFLQGGFAKSHIATRNVLRFLIRN
jgi:hypothetical protein